MKKFLIYILPVILYMGIIFFLSSIKGSKIPQSFVFNFDYLLHFIEFAILGFLIYRAFISYGLVYKGIKKLIFYTCLFCAFYGITDEIHQLFVPLREFSLSDILFDTFGGIFSALIASRIFRRKRMLEHNK